MVERGSAAGLLAMIRRAVVAVAAAAAVATAMRLRGRSGVAPQTGGWRQMRDDELA